MNRYGAAMKWCEVCGEKWCDDHQERKDECMSEVKAWSEMTPIERMKQLKLSQYETTNDFFSDFHDCLRDVEIEKYDLEKKLAEAELMRDINASQRDACMKMVLVAKEALEKINKEKTPDHINDICDEALKQLSE